MATGDTFTCCTTPMPWPTRAEDRTCPECGAVWEREPVDLGAGARIKAPGDYTTAGADAGSIAERLTRQALSDIESGIDAIPMLEAAIAALRVQAGELPSSELPELRELAEEYDDD
jgi:hypothetical protein